MLKRVGWIRSATGGVRDGDDVGWRRVVEMGGVCCAGMYAGSVGLGVGEECFCRCRSFAPLVFMRMRIV